jgi:uncharacterized protein
MNRITEELVNAVIAMSGAISTMADLNAGIAETLMTSAQYLDEEQRAKLLQVVSRARQVAATLKDAGHALQDSPVPPPSPQAHLLSERGGSEFRRLRATAELGDIQAQIDVAFACFEGAGTAKDEKEAGKWMHRAVAGGSLKARFSLGVWYAWGNVVPRDLERGVSLAESAAKDGCVEAQYWLGLCYGTGSPVARDLVKSVYWYEQAGRQGHVPSLEELGLMYEKGKGVPRDYVQAYKYFAISDAFCDSECADIRRLRRLAKKLTPEQLLDAQRLVGDSLAKRDLYPPETSVTEGERTPSANDTHPPVSPASSASSPPS